MAVNILGVGAYLPENTVSNTEFDYKSRGVTDEWLLRAGIKNRRFASSHTDYIDLAYRASLRAITQASISVDNIGLLILVASTINAECIIPTGIAELKDRLKLGNCLYLHMLESCNGVIQAMEFGAYAIESGQTDNVLIVSSETFSKLQDDTSEASMKIAMSMGDGAGAIILGADGQQNGRIAAHITSDSRFQSGLVMQVNENSKDNRASNKISFRFRELMSMPEPLKPEGVFDKLKIFSTEMISDVINKSLAKAGLSDNEIDFFILHQPNRVFLESWKEALGIHHNKTIDTLEEYGNVSSASVLINLTMACQLNKIRSGDTIVMASVGENSAGCSIWTWNNDKKPENYLLNEQPMTFAGQLINSRNYTTNELRERFILPDSEVARKPGEFFTQYVANTAVFEQVSTVDAFDYVSDIRKLEEWTMSIQNLRIAKDDIYEGDESLAPAGRVFLRCLACREAYRINWLVGHDNPDDLWMDYQCQLLDAQPLLGRPGSVLLWITYGHARFLNDPLYAKAFGLMYSAHNIEINNLKKILEDRYAK